jgi:hypothetical protein
VIGWLVRRFVPRDLQHLAFLIAGGALWLFQFTRWALRFFAINYRLTTRRLFRDIGYVDQQRLQVELTSINEVRVHRGLFEQLVGVGRLFLHCTDASRPPVILEGIRQPDIVADLIRRAAEKVRAKESREEQRIPSKQA